MTKTFKELDFKAKSVDVPGDRAKRIAILVPNICNPDYRVIKQAQALAARGYDVRIYAVRRNELPPYESHNGVVYIRQPWDFVTNIISYLFGMGTRADETRAERQQSRRIYDKLLRRTPDED